ncbi:MAG TPA: HAMP domain-containing sensor histidine kinase, partial [Planctomycetota bacterium]|nr:HAMP domain-containing sensor histidine kinase [Planctomycetota bacterium]
LLAGSAAADGAVRGAALEADVVARRALDAPEVRAFADLGLHVRLGRLGDDALVAGPAGAPWPADAALSVVAADLEGFRAAERRKLAIGGALAAAAVLLAVGAVVAGRAAWRRESEALERRRNFTAAVTHELKTPLAAVKLLAELLRRGDVDDATARDFAGRIVGESDRLSRLVGSVLELAKLEHADARGMRAEVFDLAATAADAAETFAPVARAKGFDVAVSADGPRPVRGDPESLRGAVLNLLDNALKYSDLPHVLEVEVGAAAPGVARLAVSDRGRGVSADDVARIFEPYARAGDELTRDRPGVGLGLALAARIARAHGGACRYAPRPGGGSVFTLEIPEAGPT